MQYVIHEKDSLNPWNYYNTREDAEKEAEILRLEQPNKEIQVLTIADFCVWQEKQILTGVVQISRQAWWYALEVLPPVEWFPNKTPETFFMSEHLTGPYTEQYGRVGNVYIKKTVNTLKKETHITEDDFKGLQPLAGDIEDDGVDGQEVVA